MTDKTLQLREIRPPTYYTIHGGRPTNTMEWRDQNFGVGAFYASQCIQVGELESDWPEVFNNKDCMRGFDPGAFPPPGVWPNETEWELTWWGEPTPPWIKFDDAGRPIPPWRT